MHGGGLIRRFRFGVFFSYFRNYFLLLGHASVVFVYHFMDICVEDLAALPILGISCVFNLKYNAMMKKCFFVLCAMFLFSACEDEHGLDNDYLVFTDYDKESDFSSYHTYYLPDSILYIGYSQKPEYISGASAERLLSTYTAELGKMGYSRVEDKNQADLGIQITLVGDTRYFVSYVDSPYWWWGYPGYWDPYYWGDWGYWYYPYPVYYSYSTGSLLTDMVNLKSEKGKNEKLPVIWNSYISGMSTGSKYADMSLLVKGVVQSFRQSDYLKH